MALKVRKAVIPAAGLGTRFLPATKAVPKEMLPILDKPVIQYIVEGLSDFKSGKARLLENDFAYVSDERSELLLRNQDSFKKFIAAAEGMIQMMDGVLNSPTKE